MHRFVYPAMALVIAMAGFSLANVQSQAPIRFVYQAIPFHLESDESPARNAPETMAGGVAIFDYNGDGKPDIFFTNGASLATLHKDEAKYSNHLFRNDGGGKFTDVTASAGLPGSGFDVGVAVGDYDNDGFPDLFVAGVHRNTLYHNKGDGTFQDVTESAGLAAAPDPEFGSLWGVAGAWVDVNNDGLLDLVVVNYVQWTYSAQPLCGFRGTADYCHPRYYKGQPNSLFLNMGNEKFKEASREWGLREHVGKGMGIGVADYDVDGKPDLFIPNDAYYNSMFHNIGKGFEELAMQTGTALPDDGNFISGMGLDFRDVNNDGLPDISLIALNNQTFPLFLNRGKSLFEDATTASGLRALTIHMAGFGVGMYDLDNDGWKDLFVTRGHVGALPQPGQGVDQNNTVFRNEGASGTWKALTEEAGLTAMPPARHRGCAFGDLDGDGRIDVVTTAIGKPAEIWLNRSPERNHWIEIALEGTRSNRDGLGAKIKMTSKSGVQYNDMTESVGYASSSYGPVHFGMGADARAESIEIAWPSGVAQKLTNVAADRVLRVKEPAK